jgi:hypothetical protein
MIHLLFLFILTLAVLTRCAATIFAIRPGRMRNVCRVLSVLSVGDIFAFLYLGGRIRRKTLLPRCAVGKVKVIKIAAAATGISQGFPHHGDLTANLAKK